jgi:Tol biopolymer transport system component
MYAVDTVSGVTTAIRHGDDHVRPDWRPDGRLLYYVLSTGKLVARDVQAATEAVVADLRAEGVEPAKNLTGRGYRLGPDGFTVAYAEDWRAGDASGRRLAVKTLGGGPARELVRATAPETLQFQDWTPDGASLIYTRWTAKPDQSIALWRVSIHGGEPQPLGLSMPGVRDVTVRPDGNAITFTAGWPKNELWVLENFLGER